VLSIEPVSPEHITDSELRALVERAVELGVPDAYFCGVLARVPALARPVLRAMLMSHTEGTVDHTLKEKIRVRLARTAGDLYSAALRSHEAENGQPGESGSRDDDEDPDRAEAERWALRYAHLMYLQPAKLDADFYAGLKKHFSEAQIMELGAFIALHYGMYCFARTLRDPQGSQG
jgi:alkylhydroperoxidase family enzyme